MLKINATEEKQTVNQPSFVEGQFKFVTKLLNS